MPPSKPAKGAVRPASAFFQQPLPHAGAVGDHPAAQMAGVPIGTPLIVVVDIDNISPNPNNPRKVFEQKSIDSLAESISLHGMQYPLLISRTETTGKFILVGGERRYRACKQLGMTSVNAVITTGNPDEIALIDNLQRIDLNPLEMALAFKALLDSRPGLSQSDVGKMVGRSRTGVSQIMGILRLSPEVRADFAAHAEGVGHRVLYEIAKIEDPAHQWAAWELVRGGATVLELGNAIRDMPACPESTSNEAGEAIPLTSPSMPKAAAPLNFNRHLSIFIKSQTRRLHSLTAMRPGGTRLDQKQIDGLRAMRATIDRLLDEC